MITRCPACNKPVDSKSEYLPFCCERCKLVDLGQWLEGNYRIGSSETGVPEEMEEDELPRTRH